VPLNDDGFFVEAHVKLRPVEFTTAGVFVAGLAHSPKPIDESIAQAKAAASRASVVLAKDMITVEGVVARVNEDLCWGCGRCEETCPFGAPSLTLGEDGQKVSHIQEALCKGCGACAAVCPTGAASIFHYDDREVLSTIEAALEIQ
jgi:heterodisulfide reductase subunit A